MACVVKDFALDHNLSRVGPVNTPVVMNTRAAKTTQLPGNNLFNIGHHILTFGPAFFKLCTIKIGPGECPMQVMPLLTPGNFASLIQFYPLGCLL
jgi:hypothetical protein